MSTYFDAVVDRNLQPLFNDTPEKVKRWLEERPEGFFEKNSDLQVALGKELKFVSVQEYLGES